MSDTEYWRAQLFAGELESSEGLLLVTTMPEDMIQPIACEVHCESPDEYASVMRLMGSNNVSIRAYRSVVGGSVSELLEIENAHIRQASAPTYGNEHRKWLATIECGNTLRRILLPTENATNTEPFSWVYVTENPYLAVTGLDKPQQDGSLIAAEPFEDLQVDFSLHGLGQTARFARVYDWTHERHTLTRTARLAVKIPKVNMGEDPSVRADIHQQVDDFLLLAGLATGVFAQSIGFDSSGDGEACRGYRRDRSLPRDTAPEDSYTDTVVSRDQLQHFWTLAYTQFCASPYRGEIRTCLHALRANTHAYLEPAFLTNFSVLELLLSRHRERHKMGLVLRPDSYKEVRKAPSKQISELTNLDKSARRVIRANLPQLNRVPIGSVFEHFVDEFDVDLTGLWPIVMPNNKGIIAARNLLVHGATVTTDERFQKALSIANAHLRWSLEICLLALLEWPRAKSNRTSNALRQRHLTAMDTERLEAAQQDTAEFSARALG